MAGRHSKDDDKSLNAVVMIILLIFLMPVAGIIMLGSKSVVIKVIGGILVVLGVIIWIKFLAG